MMTELTAAILAGGKSSRMGTDKAFVELAGRTLIEHMLAQIPQVSAVRETIVITNDPEPYEVLELPLFPDRIPGKGALGGIYTAIHASQHAHTLVLACDMPLINPALLRYMTALCAATDPPPDVIVPRVEGYPQGLHAIYSKTCLAPIQKDLEADRLKVIGFYPAVRVRYLDEAEYRPYDPQQRAFFNVNTPEDLTTARELLARE